MADLSVFEFVKTTAEHIQRARQVQRLLAAPSTAARSRTC